MFNILEHLDKFEHVTESATQITLRCPCCYSKLQVKRKTGAYFCVAGCTSYDIRKELGLQNNSGNVNFCKPLPVEIRCPDNIQLHPLSQPISPFSNTYISAKHSQRVTRTEYIYSDTFKIVRIDLLVDGGKKFYPLVLRDENWIVDSPDVIGFYNASYVNDPNSFVVFVEGEKCATALSNEGILAITAPSFGWSETWLKRAMTPLKGRAGGFIYVPDNDAVGYKKAIDVKYCAWDVGLPCKVVNLSAYLAEKEDVADLIEKGIDVVSIIRGLI